MSMGLNVHPSSGKPGSDQIKRLGTRIRFAVWILIYMVVLSWSYQNLLYPIYWYSGLSDPTEPTERTLLRFLLGVLPCLWLPIQVKRASHAIIMLLFVFLYIPLTLIIGNISTNTLPFDDQIPLVLAVMLALLMAQLLSGFPPIIFGSPKISMKFFMTMIWGMYIVFTFVVILTFGVRFRFDNPLAGLATRYESREVLSQENNAIVAYAMSWLTYVLLPILFGLGMLRKKYWILVIILFTYLVLYTFAAQRSVLVAFPLLVGVWILLRPKANFGNILVRTLVVVMAIGVVVDRLTGTILTTALLLYRALFLPAQLNVNYFGFFQDNPQLHLTATFLGPFIAERYPYDLPYQRLIGLIYTGNVEANANASIFADGFANYGLEGIVLAGLVLGLYLWLYNSVSHNKNLRLVVVISTISSIVGLPNNPLQTMLLTGGLAMQLVLIWLFPEFDTSPTTEPVDKPAAQPYEPDSSMLSRRKSV